MPNTPEWKIMGLEAKVKLLEKQKSFLEQQGHVSDKKAIIFDMMINLASNRHHKNSSSNVGCPNNLKICQTKKETIDFACYLLGILKTKKLVSFF